MPYVPLKLKIELRTPVVLGHPYLHADGIMAHLHQRVGWGQDFWNLPSRHAVSSPNQHVKKTGLRFAKIRDWEGERDNTPYFHCASAWKPARVQSVTIFGRFDNDSIDLWDAKTSTGRALSKKIDTQRGPFKDRVIDLVLCRDRVAEFRFFGERAWLEALARHLTHLGKKAAIGWGEIAGFEWEELDDARLVLVDEQGLARRPLPWWALSEFAQSDLQMGAIRAPYWDKTNIAPLVPVGKPCKLHREVERQLMEVASNGS